MSYLKSAQWKEIFAEQVFKLFTDKCGGDPKEFSNILHNRFTVDDFAYHDDWLYFGVLQYFQKTVIPHKIAVHEAGMEMYESEWFKDIVKFEADEDLFLHNLWVHDMSKFSANEAFGYATHNFKDPKNSHHKGVPTQDGFEKAWHHHKMNNPHHPEYWLNPNRSGQLEPIPMPDIYILEMVADWIGAGKTYGNSLHKWLPGNLHKFSFHPETGYKLKRILSLIGIDADFSSEKLTYNAAVLADKS